jgi:hypothetical protein
LAVAAAGAVLSARNAPSIQAEFVRGADLADAAAPAAGKGIVAGAAGVALAAAVAAGGIAHAAPLPARLPGGAGFAGLSTPAAELAAVAGLAAVAAAATIDSGAVFGIAAANPIHARPAHPAFDADLPSRTASRRVVSVPTEEPVAAAVLGGGAASKIATADALHADGAVIAGMTRLAAATAGVVG